MSEHRLKVWPGPFEDILQRRKRYEVRVNDRDYRVGDTLHLAEWDPGRQAATGRGVSVSIMHMTTHEPPSPLPEGVVVLGYGRMVRVWEAER